ncbi:MAG: hypothetical protein ABSF60_13780 [Verrucomicrobiota bacterium]
MKTGILLGLCVVLGAGSISIRAADNPAQAVARAALEQKMNKLDHPPVPPAPPVPRLPRALRIPVSTTPAGIGMKQRYIYAASATGTVSCV